MIVPDVNVLIHAMDEGAPTHERAWDWWSRSMHGTEHIGFTWAVLMGYFRIVTDPRILRLPFPIAEASAHVREWMALPRAHVLEPGPEHVHVMERMLAGAGRAGDLVPDAHLAALAFEHGGTVYSSDKNFARFPLVRWVDPTA